MQMKRAGRIQYLEAKLGGDNNIIHGFTTRHEGVSRTPYNSLNLGTNTLDQEYNVEGNRNLLARTFGSTPDKLVTVKQVHGTDILVIDEPNEDVSHFLALESDAIITNQPDIMIGICVADCAPILFCDTNKKVIAAVHAGWQGTANKLAKKTILAMKTFFDSNPEDIQVAIGPCIGQCCYEVDTPVKNIFQQNGYDWSLYTKQKDSLHWNLDLVAANRDQIIDNGIPFINIESADTCVCCQRDLFFSYRRDEGETGRQMGFIMLKTVSAS